MVRSFSKLNKIFYLINYEMVRAWYMDNNLTIDQRESHHLDPPKIVDLDKLKELGVLYWQVIEVWISFYYLKHYFYDYSLR